MKMEKTLLASVLAAGLTASLSVQAASFGIYDPRSLAMGGVGVTTATSRNASYFNPAALAAAREDDDFAFNLTVAARAADPDKLIDDIDDVEDAGNSLSNALDALNAAVNNINAAGASVSQLQINQGASAAAQTSTAITQFNTALQQINRKTLELGAFGGGIIAIPSKNIGIGLYASGRLDAGARFSLAPTDSALLVAPTTGYAAIAATISGNLNTCTVSSPATCVTGLSTLVADRDLITTSDGEVQNLQSTFDARGAVITEIGISLARRFTDYGNVDIGVTPKMIKATTFNYSVSAQNTDFDTDTGKREQNAFSLDVGATKSYGDEYKAGVTIKNLIGKKLALANSNETIDIKPQVRLGVSHHTNWTTVGIDADLIKNKGLGNGFSKDTQFVGLGAELDVWLLQLRAGYRHDLAGNYDGMPSLGLGLNLFGLHLDAGVAGNAKEKAASLQLGLNF